MSAQRERRWATKAVAAEYGGYSERTIERWINEKRLPGYKVGRLIRVDLNEIDDLLTGSRVEVES